MQKDIVHQIEELTDKIATQPASDLYYSRGKLYWQQDKKSMAITDFNHALELDPNSPAKIYLSMASDVMDFYNTDFYNP